MSKLSLVTATDTGRRTIRILTDIGVSQALPRDKRWKLHDSGGLFLLISPNGGKWWRWDYRLGGRRNTLSFGVYPKVTLAKARADRDAARKLVEAGTDPSIARQRAKRTVIGATVRDIWNQWSAIHSGDAEKTVYKRRWLAETVLLPKLGRYHIGDVQPTDLIATLRPFDERGVADTTHRAKRLMGQLLRFAVASGLAARDFSPDLHGVFRPVRVKNHPAITEPAKIGALLRAIDGCDGYAPVKLALSMAPYVFVRPSELRTAEWTELDLDSPDGPLWRLPAAKMKGREPHLVPLARQVVAILRDAHAITGTGRYVFPATRTIKRPMSNGTLNAALKRLGYTSKEMVPHGFRAMASTRMNEMDWSSDLIELQLAHTPTDKTRAIYNRSSRLEECRELMQKWADYLDTLRLRAVR